MASTAHYTHILIRGLPKLGVVGCESGALGDLSSESLESFIAFRRRHPERRGLRRKRNVVERLIALRYKSRRILQRYEGCVHCLISHPPPAHTLGRQIREYMLETLVRSSVRPVIIVGFLDLGVAYSQWHRNCLHDTDRRLSI